MTVVDWRECLVSWGHADRQKGENVTLLLENFFFIFSVPVCVFGNVYCCFKSVMHLVERA